MRAPGALLAAALVAGCSPAAAPTTPAPAPGDAPSVSLPAPAAGDDDVLRDVLAGSGITHRHVIADGALDNLIESVGSGVTVLDFDGDGRLDLYFVLQGPMRGTAGDDAARAAGRNRLYRNLGGMRFEDVTDHAGVGDAGFGFMAVAADLDDDGDTDLYVLNDGPNVLYRNDGGGTFSDVTTAAGVAGDACSVAGAAIDANRDGLLDLYVGNYVAFDPEYELHYAPDVFPGPLAYAAQPDVLYVNDGGGAFHDGTAAAGLAVTPGRAMGVSVLDYDGDGRLSLFVANDATANFLFVPRGDGTFVESARETGVAFGVQGEATAAMAGAVGDVNGDGGTDLHVTDAGYGSLYVSEGGGLFRDRIIPSGIASPSGQWASWGSGFLDFDLDGALDLYIANGDLHRATGRPDLLLRGHGDGRFEDVSPDAGAWFHAERMGRGLAIADLDDDGALDVVVVHVHDAPALLGGRRPEGAHSVTLDLRAKPGTAEGLGTRVRLTAGGREHRTTLVPRCAYLGQGDPRLHFGLGAAATIERIDVTWSDGSTQTLSDVAADRVVTVRQAEAGR